MYSSFGGHPAITEGTVDLIQLQTLEGKPDDLPKDATPLYTLLRNEAKKS